MIIEQMDMAENEFGGLFMQLVDTAFKNSQC